MKTKKIEKILKKGFKVYSFALIFMGLMRILPINVFAADDPIEVVNNLSDFIFQIMKVVGGIITGYGIIQVGLAFTSHDAQQRVNGFLFCLGGIIIVFAKPILDYISR